jgi:hypothetical protein
MISRHAVLLSLAGLAGAAAVLAQVLLDPRPAPPPREMPVFARAEDDAARLIAAGRSQIGAVPPERGVCTDVIVRTYRSGLGLDLQQVVHEDSLFAYRLTGRYRFRL